MNSTVKISQRRAKKEPELATVYEWEGNELKETENASDFFEAEPSKSNKRKESDTNELQKSSGEGEIDKKDRETERRFADESKLNAKEEPSISDQNSQKEKIEPKETPPQTSKTLPNEIANTKSPESESSKSTDFAQITPSDQFAESTSQEKSTVLPQTSDFRKKSEASVEEVKENSVMDVLQAPENVKRQKYVFVYIALK